MKEGDHLLGTGPYVINEGSDNTLHLHKNPYWNGPLGFEAAKITVVEEKFILEKMIENEIDFVPFAGIGGPTENKDTDLFLNFEYSFEGSHEILDLNGLNGRFFSNSQYRLAFQNLVHTAMKELSFKQKPNSRDYRQDFQTLLPTQYGRLTEKEVSSVIQKGAVYVAEFLEANKKYPLFWVSSGGGLTVKQNLEKLGVLFTKNSGVLDFKTVSRMHYKTFEPDILHMSFGVFNGDPDGIHHLLGRDGAVFSPMIGRPEIINLLEEGRSILDREKLAPHYTRVSLAILNEVPFVHLGFIIDTLAYRKDKITINSKERFRTGPRLNALFPVQ